MEKFCEVVNNKNLDNINHKLIQYIPISQSDGDYNNQILNKAVQKSLRIIEKISQEEKQENLEKRDITKIEVIKGNSNKAGLQSNTKATIQANPKNINDILAQNQNNSPSNGRNGK